MDQHLKQRPDHYRTLGLKPGAKSEDIERAFARAVSAFTPRAFGSVAQVSVAFETLRDPARRRAYDQSIGILPPPPLTRLAVPARGTLSFIGSSDTASRLAGLEPAPKPPTLDEPLVIAAKPAEPEPVQPSPVEVEAVEPVPAPPAEDESVSHFLARSQRLSSPEPLPEPKPTPPSKAAPVTFTFEPNADGEAASIRPIVLGTAAMVVAAALFGAWMGLVSTEDVPESVEAVAVESALPPPDPAAVSSAPAERPVLAVERATPVRRTVTAPPSPAPRVAEIASSAQPEAVDLAEAQQASAAEIVPASTAQMPLGKATVAQTIRKIGYPCGSVSSTAAGDGAGVFVVTCTSGHSYRAAPVNGRYRFKRL